MPLPLIWKIAADTGGTFTDCHALTPAGEERRVKVLSSGILRARVQGWDEQGAVLAQTWQMQNGFFNGWTLRSASGAGDGSNIRHSRVNKGRLHLEFYETPHPVLPGTLVELTSGEAAPVVGARLLTGTPLGQAFPPLQFRLATTRATNALLERKGTPVAFFVTQGSRISCVSATSAGPISLPCIMPRGRCTMRRCVK
ncbi:hydantoinase/oxoprolinase N-terminal domain-containing protein [Verrucomicrobium spinosum]|uniref:hydantoinase/oxoprolinase N-terminal domain-containing protein n=1 Tax=Verrucomicrobium spinosum TaxID=2736 RepID=UPI0009EC13B2|nr:hydantoinase/oxoprolinase N-terminal domain-containing protein [Verrucomicrobium spinosum]